jgi:hypothetical protein
MPDDVTSILTQVAAAIPLQQHYLDMVYLVNAQAAGIAIASALGTPAEPVARALFPSRQVVSETTIQFTLEASVASRAGFGFAFRNTVSSRRYSCSRTGVLHLSLKITCGPSLPGMGRELNLTEPKGSIQ